MLVRCCLFDVPHLQDKVRKAASEQLKVELR
jgi:hypothetical protein